MYGIFTYMYGKISRVNYTSPAPIESACRNLSPRHPSARRFGISAPRRGRWHCSHNLLYLHHLSRRRRLSGEPPMWRMFGKSMPPEFPPPKKKIGNFSGMLWPKSLKIQEIPMTWLPGAIDQPFFSMDGNGDFHPFFSMVIFLTSLTPTETLLSL